MPENEFSLQRNGCDEDAVQNHKHLKGLTKDELTDVLSDMWDTMDEINYDPAQMDVYLAELEKQEPISPDFDVNMSLAIFHENMLIYLSRTRPFKYPLQQNLCIAVAGTLPLLLRLLPLL